MIDETILSKGERELIARSLQNAVDCLLRARREYRGLTQEQVDATLNMFGMAIKAATALEIDLRKELDLPIWKDKTGEPGYWDYSK